MSERSPASKKGTKIDRETRHHLYRVPRSLASSVYSAEVLTKTAVLLSSRYVFKPAASITVMAILRTPLKPLPSIPPAVPMTRPTMDKEPMTHRSLELASETKILSRVARKKGWFPERRGEKPSSHLGKKRKYANDSRFASRGSSTLETHDAGGSSILEKSLALRSLISWAGGTPRARATRSYPSWSTNGRD